MKPLTLVALRAPPPPLVAWSIGVGCCGTCTPSASACARTNILAADSSRDVLLVLVLVLVVALLQAQRGLLPLARHGLGQHQPLELAQVRDARGLLSSGALGQAAGSQRGGEVALRQARILQQALLEPR